MKFSLSSEFIRQGKGVIIHLRPVFVKSSAWLPQI